MTIFKPTPSKTESRVNEKITKALTHDELASIAGTMLGMAYHLGKQILKDITPAASCQLPHETQYALVQTHNMIDFFSRIVKSKDGRVPKKCFYAPPSLAKDDKDCKKRLIALVTALYEGLKKEGKIPVGDEKK